METQVRSQTPIARVAIGVVVFVLAGIVVALLGALVGDPASSVVRIDDAVLTSLHAYALDHPGFVRAMIVVTNAGSPLVFQVLGTGFAIWAMVRRRWRLAIWALVLTWGAKVTETTLKLVYGRPRPSFPDPVALAPNWSYPSGHTSGALAGCILIAVVLTALVWPRRRVLVWTLALLFAVAVAFSRMALGVHFLSDVMAGWLIGIAWAVAVTMVVDPLRYARISCAASSDT